MYIAGTQYRIHGTNNPATIGKHVSSGCIRMTNDNAIDLYNRVRIGAKVIVLPQNGAVMREARAAHEDARAAAAAPQAEARPIRARTSWNVLRSNGVY